MNVHEGQCVWIQLTRYVMAGQPTHRHIMHAIFNNPSIVAGGIMLQTVTTPCRCLCWKKE